MNLIKMLCAIAIAMTFLFPAQAEEESAFYAEAYLNAYQGEEDFNSQEIYTEYAFEEGVAVWANGYHDEWGHTVYGGLSKSWDNGWTAAIGVGRARFDGASQNVIAPWVSYSSEEWEFFLSGERYQGDEDPWFYQGYLGRYAGSHLVGVYAEKDFGVGPFAQFALGEYLAIRVAVPVADKSETDLLLALIFMY